MNALSGSWHFVSPSILIENKIQPQKKKYVVIKRKKYLIIHKQGDCNEFICRLRGTNDYVYAKMLINGFVTYVVAQIRANKLKCTHIYKHCKYVIHINDYNSAAGLSSKNIF